MDLLGIIDRVLDARHHQALVGRHAVVVGHGQRATGHRLDPFDHEHVVVVVIVDAGVVHDPQVGIGDHVAVGVQRPEHAHRVAPLDAVGVRRRRASTLGVERRIGGQAGHLDAEDLFAGPAIGDGIPAERRAGKVTVVDQRQQRLVVVSLVVGKDDVLVLVARRMDTQRRPATTVVGGDLGDLGLAYAVGQRPVARQHLVVVDRPIQVEVVEHRVLAATGGRQTIDLVAEAEHLPDLVDVGFPATLVTSLPEAGHVDLGHRRVLVIGHQSNATLEDTIPGVGGRRRIGVPVEQHRDRERLTGSEGQAVERTRIGQHEGPVDIGLENLQRLAAAIGDRHRGAVLELAIIVRGAVVLQVAEVQAVGEVGSIAALHLDIGVVVTGQRRHVEVVEVIGTIGAGYRAQVVLDAGLKLDVDALLAVVTHPGIGQAIDGLPIEGQRQRATVIGTGVGRQVQTIETVAVHREVEVGGQLIDGTRTVAILELDAATIGDIGVDRDEDVTTVVRHPQQVDVGAHGIRRGQHDGVAAGFQVDQHVLEEPVGLVVVALADEIELTQVIAVDGQAQRTVGLARGQRVAEADLVAARLVHVHRPGDGLVPGTGKVDEAITGGVAVVLALGDDYRPAERGVLGLVEGEAWRCILFLEDRQLVDVGPGVVGGLEAHRVETGCQIGIDIHRQPLGPARVCVIKRRVLGRREGYDAHRDVVDEHLQRTIGIAAVGVAHPEHRVAGLIGVQLEAEGDEVLIGATEVGVTAGHTVIVDVIAIDPEGAGSQAVGQICLVRLGIVDVADLDLGASTGGHDHRGAVIRGHVLGLDGQHHDQIIDGIGIRIDGTGGATRGRVEANDLALAVAAVEGQQVELAGSRVLDDVQRVDVGDDVAVGITQHIVADDVAVGVQGDGAHVVTAGVLGEQHVALEVAAEHAAGVFHRPVGRAVLAQRIDPGDVVGALGNGARRVLVDLVGVVGTGGIAAIQNVLVTQRVRMAVVAALLDTEQVVILILDIGVALVLRRGGIIRHVATGRRAVGRHVEEAVGVPHQVVGVTRPGGEDRQHRVGGVGIVVGLQHVATGVLDRGYAAIVEHQELAVAHGDGIILGMTVGVIEAPVQAIVGQRFGADVEGPIGHVTGRIDLQHCGVQKTLGTVAPGAVRLAHGGVRALDQIQQMARHVRVGVRVVVRVLAELEAVGHVVAVGARQAGDIGLGGTGEAGSIVQGDLGDPSAEVRHTVVTSGQRDRIVVGDPQHIGIGGVHHQTDDAALLTLSRLVEIVVGQTQILAIGQRTVDRVDVVAQQFTADGGDVHVGAIRAHLQRGEAEGTVGGAVEFHHVVEGHVARDHLRLGAGDEGVGVLLELAGRRARIVVGATVLEAVDHQGVAGERLEGLARRDGQRIEAAGGVGVEADFLTGDGLEQPDRAVAQAFEQGSTTSVHHRDADKDVGGRIDPGGNGTVIRIEIHLHLVLADPGDRPGVGEEGVVFGGIAIVPRGQVRQGLNLDVLDLGVLVVEPHRIQGQTTVGDLDDAGDQVRAHAVGVVGRVGVGREVIRAERGEGVVEQLALGVEHVVAVVGPTGITDGDGDLVEAVFQLDLPAGPHIVGSRLVEVGVGSLTRVEAGDVIGAIIDRNAGQRTDVQWLGAGIAIVDRLLGDPAVLVGLAVDGDRLGAKGLAVVGDVAIRHRGALGLEVDLDREAIARLHRTIRCHPVTTHRQAVDVGASVADIGQTNGVVAGLKLHLDGGGGPVLPAGRVGSGGGKGQAALALAVDQDIHGTVGAVGAGVGITHLQGVGAGLIDAHLKLGGVTGVGAHVQVTATGEAVPQTVGAGCGVGFRIVGVAHLGVAVDIDDGQRLTLDGEVERRGADVGLVEVEHHLVDVGTAGGARGHGQGEGVGALDQLYLDFQGLPLVPGVRAGGVGEAELALIIAVDGQIQRPRGITSVGITHGGGVAAGLHRVDVEGDLVAGVGAEVQVGITHRAGTMIAEVVGIVRIHRPGDLALGGTAHVDDVGVLSLQGDRRHHHVVVLEADHFGGAGLVAGGVGDKQRDGEITALVVELAAQVQGNVARGIRRHLGAGRATVEGHLDGGNVVIDARDIEHRRRQLVGVEGIVVGDDGEIAVLVSADVLRNRAAAALGHLDAIDVGTGIGTCRDRQGDGVAARLQGHGDGLELPVVEAFLGAGAVRIGADHGQGERITAVDHQVQRTIGIGGVAHTDVVLAGLGHVDLPADVVSRGVTEVQIAGATEARTQSGGLVRLGVVRVADLGVGVVGVGIEALDHTVLGLQAQGRERRLVDVVDGDRHQLGGGKITVADADLDLIDVVFVGVRRQLEVTRRGKGQRSGISVDGEQRRVDTTGDGKHRRRQGGRLTVLIEHRDGPDLGQVLVDGKCGCTDRETLVDVVDRDQGRLGHAVFAVADDDRQLIDAVFVGVCGELGVRGIDEAQYAGIGVEAEQRGIGALEGHRQGVTVQVVQCQGRHGTGVFIDTDAVVEAVNRRGVVDRLLDAQEVQRVDAHQLAALASKLQRQQRIGGNLHRRLEHDLLAVAALTGVAPATTTHQGAEVVAQYDVGGQAVARQIARLEGIAVDGQGQFTLTVGLVEDVQGNAIPARLDACGRKLGAHGGGRVAGHADQLIARGAGVAGGDDVVGVQVGKGLGLDGHDVTDIGALDLELQHLGRGQTAGIGGAQGHTEIAALGGRALDHAIDHLESCRQVFDRQGQVVTIGVGEQRREVGDRHLAEGLADFTEERLQRRRFRHRSVVDVVDGQHKAVGGLDLSVIGKQGNGIITGFQPIQAAAQHAAVDGKASGVDRRTIGVGHLETVAQVVAVGVFEGQVDLEGGTFIEGKVGDATTDHLRRLIDVAGGGLAQGHVGEARAALGAQVVVVDEHQRIDGGASVGRQIDGKADDAITVVIDALATQVDKTTLALGAGQLVGAVATVEGVIVEIKADRDDLRHRGVRGAEFERQASVGGDLVAFAQGHPLPHVVGQGERRAGVFHRRTGALGRVVLVAAVGRDRPHREVHRQRGIVGFQGDLGAGAGFVAGGVGDVEGDVQGAGVLAGQVQLEAAAIDPDRGAGGAAVEACLDDVGVGVHPRQVEGDSVAVIRGYRIDRAAERQVSTLVGGGIQRQ